MYTETALQAVIRESREEVEFTNAAGEVFEPRYKWIASFDEGVYNFEAFATVIDVNAEIASKEPNKARLLWAKLDEWRAFDTLTRSSVVVMGRLRELETEFAHRTEVVPESAHERRERAQRIKRDILVARRLRGGLAPALKHAWGEPVD